MAEAKYIICRNFYYWIPQYTVSSTKRISTIVSLDNRSVYLTFKIVSILICVMRIPFLILEYEGTLTIYTRKKC